jgi:hypothetical protein
MTRLQALESVVQRMRTIVAAREAEEGEGPITRLALDDAEQALDTLDAISADLAADGYAVEQDWQPIATAPRDGTAILCWPFNYSSLFEGEAEPEIVIGFFSEDDWWCESTVAKTFDPTHWRPLPTPPAAATEPQA